MLSPLENRLILRAFGLTIAPVVAGGGGGGIGLASAAAGPIAGAIPVLEGIFGPPGQGRQAADKWNKNFHDPMVAQLNTIKTPEDLMSWMQKYLQGAQSFVNQGGSEAQKVITQALYKTPAFGQTIDTMWNQLGGPQKYGTQSLMSTIGTQTPGSLIDQSITTGLDNIGMILNPTAYGQPSRGGSTTSDPSYDPTDPAQGGTGIPDGYPQDPGGPQGPGLPGDPSTGVYNPSIWTDIYNGFKKIFGNNASTIMKYITGGTGVATSIYGAVTGANAARDAAKIEADAYNHATDTQAQTAKDTLGFIQNVFNTSQANMKPWLESGQGALGMLNTLTGNPSGPQNTNINPNSVQMMPLGAAQNYNGMAAQPPAPPAMNAPQPAQPPTGAPTGAPPPQQAQNPFSGLRRVAI